MKEIIEKIIAEGIRIGTEESAFDEGIGDNLTTFLQRGTPGTLEPVIVDGQKITVESVKEWSDRCGGDPVTRFIAKVNEKSYLFQIWYDSYADPDDSELRLLGEVEEKEVTIKTHTLVDSDKPLYI